MPYLKRHSAGETRSTLTRDDESKKKYKVIIDFPRRCLDEITRFSSETKRPTIYDLQTKIW